MTRAVAVDRDDFGASDACELDGNHEVDRLAVSVTHAECARWGKMGDVKDVRSPKDGHLDGRHVSLFALFGRNRRRAPHEHVLRLDIGDGKRLGTFDDVAGRGVRTAYPAMMRWKEWMGGFGAPRCSWAMNSPRDVRRAGPAGFPGSPSACSPPYLHPTRPSARCSRPSFPEWRSKTRG